MPITAARLLVQVGADTSEASQKLNSFDGTLRARARQMSHTMDSVAASVQRIGGEFQRATNPVNLLRNAVSNFGASFTGVFAGTFTAQALISGLQSAANFVTNLGREALDSYAYTERLQLSLRALAGRELVQGGFANNLVEGMTLATGRAAELYDWIRKVAIESPFDRRGVADAYRLGLAYGFTTEEAKRLTQATVDFTSATGQSGDIMTRISLALGQIRARGKLASQEINQLSEAGINVREALADALGISTAEVVDLTERGLIPADFALETIFRTLEQYSGAGREQMGTFSGLLNSLEDLKQITLENFFGGFFEAAKPHLEAVVNLLNDDTFQANVKATGDQFGAWAGLTLDSLVASVQNLVAAINSGTQQEPAWFKVLKAIGALQGGNIEISTKIIPGAQPFDVPVQATVTKVNFDPSGNYSWTYDTAAQVTTVDFLDESNPSGFAWVYDAKAGIKRVDWYSGEDGLVNFTWTYDAKAKIGRIYLDPSAEKPVIALDIDWSHWKASSLSEGVLRGLGGVLPAIPFEAKWKEGTVGHLLVSAAKYLVSPFPTVLFDAKWKENTFGSLLEAAGRALITPAPLVYFDAALKQTSVAQLAGTVGSVIGKALNLSVADLLDVGRLFRAGTSVLSTWDWPDFPSWDWPDFPSWDWPSIPAPTWQWPSIPAPDWLNGLLRALGLAEAAAERGPANTHSFPRKPLPSGYTSPDGSGSGGIPGLDKIGRATGDRAFRGGWALVGEEGPELVQLPTGTRIFSNPDTKRMLAMAEELGIPAFADGNTPAPPLPMGPDRISEAEYQKLRESILAQTKSLDDNTSQLKKQGRVMEDAFRSALSKAPGLFGTSPVTADQMRMAELGIPQNFADDYLRRLSDEVLNGVDWQDVDIKDAAQAAGIDPNLPAEAILELFKQAWQDSSLFSNPENLRFINQDAVRQSIERQQASLQGQANIMALFGLSDENLNLQIQGLGQALAGSLAQNVTPEQFADVGKTALTGVGNAFSDDTIAAEAMSNAATAMQSSLVNDPDTRAAWAEVGANAWQVFQEGFKPATGAGTSTPGSNVPPGGIPAFAAGTRFFRGGLALVGDAGPELVELPYGSRVYSNPEAREMAGGVTVNMGGVVVRDRRDVDYLVYRLDREARRWRR